MKKLYAALICSAVTGGVMAQTLPYARAAKIALAPAHAATPVAPAERGAAIWSDDFSDPSTWTTGGSGANDWVIGTTAPDGDFPVPAIASTSADNGWALYDSDLHCASSDNAYIQNAAPIDLTGFPAVQLQFEENYRKFHDQTFVDVSNDGVNFTSFEVNGTIPTNGSSTNPQLVTVPISSVAGNQGSVYIRFRFTSAAGCDYSWQVDDVSILEVVGSNLTLVQTATTAYDEETAISWDSLAYTIYPISELRPLQPNMLFTNNGAGAENATATISTSDGFSASNTVSINPVDTLQYIASGYTPTAVIGDHTIDFTVTGDNTDADPADNSGSLSVAVSQSIYARDDGSMAYILRDTITGPAFKVANGFHTVVDEVLYSIDAVFYNTSTTGIELNAQLLDPSTADFSPIAESQYHTLEASDLSAGGEGNFVSFIFDPPVQLSAGSDYLAAIQHFGGADVTVGGSDLIPPAQTSFIYRSTRSDWFYLGDVMPMIRMTFVSDVGIGAENVHHGMGLGQNSPNPANGTTRVNYSLDNAAMVNLALYDINGKLVRSLVQGNMAAGNHGVDLNTADLQEGVYFYTLTTDKSTATKRMTVVH